MNINDFFNRIFQDRAGAAYAVAYERAAGHDGPVPLPVAQAWWVDDSGTIKWAWTKTKDDDGLYWSFRIETGLIPKFTEWKSHKQRQGAKTWARVQCREETARRTIG